MRTVLGGSFMMGADDGLDDEKPLHRVTVAGFEIDTVEVTVAGYRECVEARACTPVDEEHCHDPRSKEPAQPVTCVRWDQAVSYCSWRGKRLPTEEEWEYAARGSDGRVYPWGDREPLTELCWRPTTPSREPCPVGLFPGDESPFGVRDMAGNVHEWTANDYSPGYDEPRSDEVRVVRGGAWSSGYPVLWQADPLTIRPSAAPGRLYARLSIRRRNRPDEPFNNVGFRCVRPGE